MSFAKTFKNLRILLSDENFKHIMYIISRGETDTLKLISSDIQHMKLLYDNINKSVSTLNSTNTQISNKIDDLSDYKSSTNQHIDYSISSRDFETLRGIIKEVLFLSQRELFGDKNLDNESLHIAEIKKNTNQLLSQNTKLIEQNAQLQREVFEIQQSCMNFNANNNLQNDTISLKDTILNLNQSNAKILSDLENEKKKTILLSDALKRSELELSNKDIKITELEKKVVELQKQLDTKQIETTMHQINNMPIDTIDLFKVPESEHNTKLSVANLEEKLSVLIDTSSIETYILKSEDGADSVYFKMIERYKNNLNKKIVKMDFDDEIEDNLNIIMGIIQNDLLKKVYIAIYRGLKNNDSKFEKELLSIINDYLKANSIYSREVKTGDTISDKDYEDMEFIKDNKSTGYHHGEISEVELLPYYINYINEDGEIMNSHTQGSMIVIA